MNEILIILLLMIMYKYVNFFILSNMMFLMSFMFLMKMSWINWIYIVGGLGNNYYSNYLILLMLWIFGLIYLNLKDYSKSCLMMNFLLMVLMVLNFMSINLLFFYFMYESSLLLIFYMIIKWGYSEDRALAAFYLMFYTLVFSLPMLYLIYKLMNLNGSMIFFELEMIKIYFDYFNFLYLLMSFLVKIPMYMFHGWLIKAHVEASFFSSMILASIMLKLGSYGFLRLILIFKLMLKDIMY